VVKLMDPVIDAVQAVVQARIRVLGSDGHSPATPPTQRQPAPPSPPYQRAAGLVP
jgi:hypothetical protein